MCGASDRRQHSLLGRRCMNHGGQSAGRQVTDQRQRQISDRRRQATQPLPAKSMTCRSPGPNRWLVQSSCRWPAVIPGGGPQQTVDGKLLQLTGGDPQTGGRRHWWAPCRLEAAASPSPDACGGAAFSSSVREKENKDVGKLRIEWPNYPYLLLINRKNPQGGTCGSTQAP